MTSKETVASLVENSSATSEIKIIAKKVLDGKRISVEEGLILYETASLSLLGMLANFIREKLHGDKVFFNRNFHIEPTNKCVFDCKFCAYSRKIQQEEDAWELTEEEMLHRVKMYDGQPVTEVHIVGGVHPKMNLKYFAELIQKIKIMRPKIHVKAFTAVELEYMFRKAKVNYEEGFKILKEHGLDSIPGGGAEIFDAEIRKQICDDKATSEQWLSIHEAAHQMGIPSNCTMLYGHIENYSHRLDHMNSLRELQDTTNGFNTFIPLKFRHENSQMDYLPEVSVVEDMRCYAMARIFIDNIPHLKAYWPMMGRSTSQLLLNFGVDDMDGTIDDSTKIYSMAGSQEKNPAMSSQQLVELIKHAHRIPIERDTVYNTIRDWSNEVFETPKINSYQT